MLNTLFALSEMIAKENSEKGVVEGLTIFYNNIGSVSANLHNLAILIAESKPSVIALTETWFKKENEELF